MYSHRLLTRMQTSKVGKVTSNKITHGFSFNPVISLLEIYLEDAVSITTK